MPRRSDERLATTVELTAYGQGLIAAPWIVRPGARTKASALSNRLLRRALEPQARSRPLLARMRLERERGYNSRPGAATIHPQRTGDEPRQKKIPNSTRPPRQPPPPAPATAPGRALEPP